MTGTGDRGGRRPGEFVSSALEINVKASAALGWAD